ncbi:MAG: BON domain-containing protein [Holophagales bacterium]|nr:BON domain-containing protein [Holophagales bacterium]MYB20727.1 BON domain-containing protein [Holophagales bacterium]MYF94798.1 BON domain-containing protein [Holophagales bacterium]MYH23879.1 BON domain-containing protein [Holophagales bacterium]
MREPSVILMGVVLLLVLGAVCFALEVPRIEATIERRTAATLADVGVRDLRIEADGREVTLHGTIAFAEIGLEAARRAAGEPGVRSVENRLVMAGEPSFEFGLDGDIWLLAGRLPTPESRQELFDAAAAIVGQGNVIDETEVDAAVTEPPWIPTLPRLIQLLRLVHGGPGLRLHDGTLTVTGHASSEAMRDRLEFDMAAIAEATATGWTIANEMVIAPVAVNRVAQNRIRRLLQEQPITFQGRTDALTEDARTAIAGVGELLDAFSDIRVEILVRTDLGSDPEADRGLSIARAESIREVLSASVHPDRLLAFGYGSDSAADEDGAGISQGIEFRVLHRP